MEKKGDILHFSIEKYRTDMKIYKNNLTKLIITTLFFGLFCAAGIKAGEPDYLIAEVFSIPDYNTKVPHNFFTDIGLDGKTGNISLVNDYAWCEIPYRNGEFDFKRSFIAPTKGYKLKAIASNPNGVYVFDVLANSIMADRKNYKVPVKINNPTCMAYHKGEIYVADKSAGKIYKLRLIRGQAKILQTFKAHKSICGLASDGNFLYSCDSNNIYKYDFDMNRTLTYKLNVSISGITLSGSGEILAIAKNKRKIYRFKGSVKN